MVRPFPTQRRAETFQGLLEDPSSARLAPADRELLSVVAQLRAVAAPAARPDFVTDLRATLLLEATSTLGAAQVFVRRPVPPIHRRHRGLAVAATVMTVVGATSSLSYAAQGALPGQALYPLKRVMEDTRVDLASGPAKTGGLIDHAGTRLQEVAALTARGDVVSSSQVATTLAAFTTQADDAGRTALGSGDDAQISDLRRFAATSLTWLVALEVDVPVSARPELRYAAAEVVLLDQQALSSCPGCDGGQPLTLPPTLTDLDLPGLFPGFGLGVGTEPVVGVSAPQTLDPGLPPTDGGAPGATTGQTVPDPTAAGTAPDPASGGTTAPASSGDTTDPGTTDPGTTTPGATDPGSTDPVDVVPVVPDPTTTDGASTGTVTTDSGSTDSGTTDSGSTDSGSTDSGTTGTTGTTDSGSTDSGSTGTTDPGSTDSGSTDSGSTGTTDPGSTDSGSTDSGSTDSGSTDSGSTGSGSTGSGTTSGTDSAGTGDSTGGSTGSGDTTSATSGDATSGDSADSGTADAGSTAGDTSAAATS